MAEEKRYLDIQGLNKFLDNVKESYASNTSEKFVVNQATKALQDEDGNNIKSTYLKKDSLSAGTGINITEGTISVDTTVVQQKLTPSTGITINNNTIAVNTDTIQSKLTANNGVVISNNVISADTTVVQGKLTAGSNITIDSNNVISATGGGSAGLPCISSVYNKQVNTDSQIAKYYELTSQKGRFSELLFTTNMDLNTLLEKKNDLYVGLYRSKIHKVRMTDTYGTGSSGMISKMVLQNDRRTQSNLKLRCWREDRDGSRSSSDPRRYFYFYVPDDYESVEELMTDDCEIATYIGHSSFTSNYGTCLNSVTFAGLCVTDVVQDSDMLYRYEEGDIDTICNTSNIFSEVTPDTLRCREAVRIFDGKKYFIWSNDFTSEGNTVYSTNVENYIPDRVGELVESGVVSDYTLGKWRHDIKYFYFNPDDLTSSNVVNIVKGIYNSTHNVSYPLSDGHYHWKVYWMDYPIIPFRLADCKVFINLKSNEIPEEYRGEEGTFIKLKELELRPYKNLMKQIVFKYPYDSDELWLRFCSWQKRVLYQWEWEEMNWDPSHKNSLRDALWIDSQNWPRYAFQRRSFGRQRNIATRNYSDYGNKTTEYIEFNLLTSDDISFNLESQSTPIQKRLVSVNDISRLND